jgi:DNA repair exonuclease SbcCD nuclease subunit
VFVHTADLQLGLKLRSIPGDKGARARQQRFDVIERIAEVARRSKAVAVVVAGDVFDDNAVGPDVLQLARDAFAKFPCAVLLLPGNHDHLDPGCALERLKEGRDGLDHVHVLDSTEPVTLGKVTFYPCPLTQRHVFDDPTAHLESVSDESIIHVAIAHGGIISFGESDTEVANLIDAQKVIEKGFDYLALGDWHGRMSYSDRVHYSGAPEATRFKEQNPGLALVVEIGAHGQVPVIKEERVNRTRWLKKSLSLDAQGDVDALEHWFQQLDEKSWSAVELRLDGALTLEERTHLDKLLERMADDLMYLRIRVNEVLTRPSEEELANLDVPGYLSASLDEIRALETATADEALRLYHRILMEERQ